MNIADEERAGFFEAGILNLERRVPRSLTEPAKQAVLEELERLGLRQNGKWHTKKFDGVSPFQVAAKLALGLRHQRQFQNVVPPDLVAFVNELAGCTLDSASPHPMVLVTPPQKETWSLPENGWHVDIAASHDGAIPGIQVFVLLDDVVPKGGGTLAILGSHRTRVKVPTPEHVLEMSGRAGDVYLIDMRVLHAPSINASKKARMMLTNRYLARS